jgi:hypothetical protein
VFVSLAVFINLITAIVFLLSSMTGETCDAVTSGAILDKLIDNPETFDGKYPLGKVVGNDTYPLLVRDVLDGCRNNEAIWTVLHLDLRKNISETLDIRSMFNISDQFNLLTLDSTQIISDLSTQNLEDVLGVNLTAIDFSSFYQQLSQDVGFDPSSLETLVSTLLDSLTDFQTTYPGVAGIDVLINDTTVAVSDANSIVSQVGALEATRAQELVDVTFLQGAAPTIETRISTFLSDVDAFIVFFNETTAEVLDPAGLVDAIFDDIDTFVDDATGKIRNDLGQCKVSGVC